MGAGNAVCAVLPGEVADTVINCEAFGAVARKLFNTDRAGHAREDVLGAIDSDDIAFAASAHTPAAFLASRLDY